MLSDVCLISKGEETTNAANEELVISLKYGREVQERKPIYRLLHHYNSLSNKMDNSLLAVKDINHKYIVVERRAYAGNHTDSH